MLYICDVMDWCDSYDGPQFHALLTDPPYHLGDGFMGKEWDKGNIAFNPELWSRLKEHLLPGAYGMAFCGSYNWDLLVSAIRQAGFIVHPTIFGWIYGTGMGRGTRIKDENYEGHRYGKQAMKGSIEPIVCFQKPYALKPQESIRRSGAGAININAPREVARNDRYPSNVVLSSDAAKIISEAHGSDISDYFFVCDWNEEVDNRLDESTPMFYCPKASRAERDIGLDEYEDVKVGVLEGRQDGSFSGPIPMGKNDHPTVKPIKLTTWLASLLLPPDNVPDRRILVPFGGSGSEAIGAVLAGWEHVGVIEREEHYAKMSVKRVLASSGHILTIHDPIQED